MRESKTKELVLSGMLLTLGILMPMAFHAVGGAGPVFLPMHLPVLFAGYLVAPPLAFIVGLLTPILSSVLTGMPPIFPMAVIMMFELSTYGLVVALCVKKGIGKIPALVIAMLVGRIVAGMVVAILVNLLGIRFAPPLVFLTGAVTTGLPGIVIQLVMIPSLITVLERFQPDIMKKS